MKLAFVSDLDLQRSGGGSYGVNWHAYRQLERHFDAVYCGPIVPYVPLVQKYTSKVRRRILGLPGRFAYFSPETLERNAARVRKAVPTDADSILFRSATGFARCRLRVPYFVYLDVVFHTFFHNTFDPRHFVSADLERIWREEAAFLEAAAGVFFESTWGLEQAIEAYDLRGRHYDVAGRGGVLEAPAADTRTGSSARLLTVALNFRQKGGDLVLDAYRRLKSTYPDLGWDIVGGAPEGDWRSVSGIEYHGVLRPDVPRDLQRMRRLFQDAFLLVHPTREDTNPLVLTEAAYFGCPAVSVNRFAIPELVQDGVTGVLLDAPVSGPALANSIDGLLRDDRRYRSMRANAREYALRDHSWDRIGGLIAGRITAACAAAVS